MRQPSQEPQQRLELQSELPQERDINSVTLPPLLAQEVPRPRILPRPEVRFAPPTVGPVSPMPTPSDSRPTTDSPGTTQVVAPPSEPVTESDREHYSRLARDIHLCFEGVFLNSGVAIDHIRDVNRRGEQHLKALEAEWSRRYGSSDHGWGCVGSVAYDLNCDRPPGPGYQGQRNGDAVARNYQLPALMAIFHGDQAARDAANFYCHCWGITNNADLRSFLETVADYNRDTGQVTTEGAQRFQRMMAAYNEFGYIHQNHWAQYLREDPTMANGEHTNTYFDATVHSELTGTVHLASVQLLIRRVRDRRLR